MANFTFVLLIVDILLFRLKDNYHHKNLKIFLNRVRRGGEVAQYNEYALKDSYSKIYMITSFSIPVRSII